MRGIRLSIHTQRGGDGASIAGWDEAAAEPAQVSLAESVAALATFGDLPSAVRRGWRGTGRGTSTGQMPVYCVLPERLLVLSVQAERPLWPSGPLLIRGFGVRVPGGAPVLTWRFFASVRRPANQG